jgi:inositol oxygenase
MSKAPFETLPPLGMEDLEDPEHLSALPVRDYEHAPLRVQEFYRDNHTFHTYEFNRQIWQQYASPEARTLRADMWDVLAAVGELKDASDPDVEDPQIVHAFQSAEAVRLSGGPDWLQATVLVHDVGKILATPLLQDAERPALPQWAVVGDTFPVGCAFDERIVLSKYFLPKPPEPDSDDPMLTYGWRGNPDTGHSLYGTMLGIYDKNIGLDNLTISFGHDEYLFQVLNGNCQLPAGAPRIIRYHSLYPVHNAGAYGYLLAPHDQATLRGVQHFNQFDLYSKVEQKPDIKALTAYYKDLCKEFFPKPLMW